jgi:hypothetical protein
VRGDFIRLFFERKIFAHERAGGFRGVDGGRERFFR